MQEVEITLEFITPCLGNIRRPDVDKFERDSEGRVIFLSSWWREVLRYGAQALGRHQGLVKRVRMHARITGDVKQFCRYYNSTSFKTHEAFLAKDVISARAMLPTGLPSEDFQELLRLAGEYVGISPYGWKEGYGQFLVKSVTPIARRDRAPKEDDDGHERRPGAS